MSGSGFTKGMEQLSTTQEMYSTLPPAELRNKISEIINLASTNHAKNPNTTISDAVDKAISHASKYSKNVTPMETTKSEPKNSGKGD